jgi:hypothetical protein
MLIEAARRLRAWPVYGDLGGVLLVAADGAVHYQEHNTMEARPEPDPRWRSLAWAAAAELVPELRPLLPKQPAGVPECPACGGTGRVQVTRHTPAWCGGCWGLGWRRPDDEPLSMPPTFSKNEHH